MSFDVCFLSAQRVKQFQETDYKKMGKITKDQNKMIFDHWIIQGWAFYSQQNRI
jgi:hypothetical protein